MADFFIELLNISITASYIIIAVILLRLIFRKIPKKFLCLLWGIAGIRLVFPFSVESALSLIPSTETFEPVSGNTPGLRINSGIPVIDMPVNDYLGDKYAEGITVPTDLKVTIASAASVIWLFGIAAILIYGVISYIKVKRSVSTAVLFKDNIWQSESVVSPFILGFFRPKVYIPFNMDEETRGHVIAHENAHLKRRDHWIKPLGFLILAVYWFNPLVWVAYILLCRDIEAACDEKVIAHMDNGTRKEYASALLDCAVNRRRIAACPLAFGEVSVKNRIKNVMNYRKPAFWAIILAVIACIVAAVCFLTNPEKHEFYDCGYALRVIHGEAEGMSYFLNIGYKGELYGSETYEITMVDLQGGCIELKFSEKVLESTEKNFYDDLLSGKEKIKTLRLDFGEKKTVFLSSDREDKVTFWVEKKQSLEDAITAAIMEHNKGKYTEGTYACSFHETLSTETSGTKSDSIQTVTAYVDAAYGEYVMKSGETESVGGCSMPLALTFRLENEGYSLVEYWEPESGRRYADSIRDKFPSSVAESAIKNPYHAAEKCQAKAEAYFNKKPSSASENYHYLGITKAYTTSDEVEVYVGKIDLGAKKPYITLVWNNSSEKELYTGSMFTLYRFEDNEWKRCKSKDDLSWSLEQKILLAGKSKEETYNLSVMDISENGYYRLTKDFKLGYEGHSAAAEFVVDINDGWEKLELPAGERMLVPDSLYTVYRDEVSSKQSDSWARFENYSNNGLIEYIETVEPLTGRLIKSKAELEDFIVAMTPYFNLSPLEKGTTFLDRTKEFDDEFFKENSLMVMHVNESSCSITHSLSDIYRHHQKAPEESRRESEGHVLSFEVQRNIPEMCADAEGEWFITVAMDNAAIGDIHGFYVTYGEDKIENSMVYRFDDNNSYAYIRLYDDKRMEFMFSLLSSYWPHGTYTLDEEKLVMKTDDGKNTYTFKVDGENFVFDAANSSAMPEYYANRGETYVAVPDGAVFSSEVKPAP